MILTSEAIKGGEIFDWGCIWPAAFQSLFKKFFPSRNFAGIKQRQLHFNFLSMYSKPKLHWRKDSAINLWLSTGWLESQWKLLSYSTDVQSPFLPSFESDSKNNIRVLSRTPQDLLELLDHVFVKHTYKALPLNFLAMGVVAGTLEMFETGEPMLGCQHAATSLLEHVKMWARYSDRRTAVPVGLNGVYQNFHTELWYQKRRS